MTELRRETDSLGVVEVPADKLWGAQTQRSLEHFSIGHDLIPREMIAAYATLKKAAANANRSGGRLRDEAHDLIVKVCDEILAGQHQVGLGLLDPCPLLHELDQENLPWIAVEAPPDTPAWAAIRDRLLRASSRDNAGER